MDSVTDRLLPLDYGDRVYAGVLGKIIGVYLGRPFEGWSNADIEAKLGEITGYVHEKLNVPLVVSDDDISGTFTFPRALNDEGITTALTPEQIGRTWLNYLIEGRTILWWGGMGVSTEHTAYLRLASGIPAPRSGAIATNGKVVAEQIGAQIFIDGWAMIAPGDPDLAADLARRAASVSHDGEAIYGAQVLAVMESLAFVEPDLDKLLDAGVARIPADSLIARMIGEIRGWHREDRDWRATLKRIQKSYGYDTYGGGCHIIPNHAVVILAVLYGEGDFNRSLMIANTAGWDTDCNSGNVGCLLGIRNGLNGIAASWRDPVADRMYLPTADGGRAITDAATEAARLINLGRVLKGLKPVGPKDGYRFHFEFPGAVQGFRPDGSTDVTMANVAGHSRTGSRALAIRATGPARVATNTFIPPEAIASGGYGLLASPSLYPGQTIKAEVSADPGNPRVVACRLYISAYGANDSLETHLGPMINLKPGSSAELSWRAPDTAGAPIAKVGLEFGGEGLVYLDRLGWSGAPEASLGKVEKQGDLWRRAWVDGTSELHGGWGKTLRITQNHGRGLAMQGTREWRDYRAEAVIAPRVADSFGLAVRVQGMRRYYALLIQNGMARIVKVLGGETVLIEAPFPVETDHEYRFSLECRGDKLTGSIGKMLTLEATDPGSPLLGGAIGLVVEVGSVFVGEVRVKP